jgi:Bax protein
MSPKLNPMNAIGRHRLLAAAAAIAAAGLAAAVIFQPRSPPEFPPLPNFAAYDQTADMKAAFIDYLTPIVEYQNAQILDDRSRLQRIALAIHNGSFVLWFDKEWLQQLAEKYGVEWKEDGLSAVADELLGRVDVIPVSLVIAQAAKESSWGQSKFAVVGNNLFGQWCYDEDCGIEPEQRPDGATNRVRSFDSVGNAVRSYLLNLNTNGSYAELRRIRQGLRDRHQPITGIALADGLLLYSRRREAYVEEVKMMIRQFQDFKNTRME